MADAGSDELLALDVCAAGLLVLDGVELAVEVLALEPTGILIIWPTRNSVAELPALALCSRDEVVPKWRARLEKVSPGRIW